MARINLKTWIPTILALQISLPAGAEIYKHVDAKGTVVFTNRSETVAASQRARWSPAPVQRFSRSTPSRELARHTDPGTPRTSTVLEGDAVTRVRFERNGTLMLVNVRLNDDVVAPFYVDSGCSGMSLTAATAAALGLDAQAAKSFMRTQTANGVVRLAQVQLDSVALGKARVANVPATINPHLPVGLLGAAYLNHFVYSVDPISGELVLSRRKA
jgi:clan AA aspartic protease (TIGR02281 family)